MKQDRYLKELLRFKQNEKAEAVLLIAGSPLLRKIVVAWTNTPVRKRRKTTPLDSQSEENRWAWLWRNAVFRKEDVLGRIPSSETDLEKRFEALIANRVLYPDGTANSFVLQYLREQVRKQFPSLRTNGSN